jgi:ketosteroid isomerase-like protein
MVPREFHKWPPLMHPNGTLLQRLYSALDRHDHQAMGACYHPTKEVVFHDIAFDLTDSKRILAMWHMICADTDIKATFDIIQADDREGRVSLVDEYTFKSTGNSIRNVIDSRFHFADGYIVEHRDFCDARAWASQAFGPGPKAFLAGRIRLARSFIAKEKLHAFIRKHPEYQ